MYKKCENCYKDGKVPSEESCKKCEDDLQAKEQKLEKIKKVLEVYFDDDWKATREIEKIIEE